MRYRFADCVLDTQTLRLERRDEAVPVEPQVYDLLAVLVQNPTRVISKDELIETVWQGRIVSDATISTRINAARSAVGDDGTKQAIIRTIQRRGIELRVPVEMETGKDKPKSVETAKPQRQRIKYATSRDGTRIAYAQSGSGPPILRLSHHLSHLEMDWHSQLWRPLFDRLGAHNTLVRFDGRGTGLSDSNLEGAMIDDYVADLSAVVDAADIDNFPLITHLQSTPVALRFIADNPGRVSRLVVQEGYVRGRSLREGAQDSPDADPVIALMQTGWGDPNNGFMRGFASMIMPSASAEEINQMIHLIASVAKPEDVVMARRIIDKFTAEDCLSKVDIPCLVIHARNDPIHPVEEARELAMGIPDSELLIVESSHTVCTPSDPTWEEQVSAMMDFLAEA